MVADGMTKRLQKVKHAAFVKQMELRLALRRIKRTKIVAKNEVYMEYLAQLSYYGLKREGKVEQ